MEEEKKVIELAKADQLKRPPDVAKNESPGAMINSQFPDENNKSSLSNSTSNSISEHGALPDASNSKTQPEQPSVSKKTPKDFIFGKLIGEGSFSSVYLAKDVKSSHEYAIKVCDKQHIIREKKAESVKREKDVLAILSANRNLKSPFFVRLYATFQDSERLYFVLTFGSGGELLKHLNKAGSFDIECSRFFTGEILQALRHMHKQGIVHRDLKPENILLNNNGHILITDFGSAKIMANGPASIIESQNQNQNSSDKRGRSSSFVGTAQYVSPEVLRGKYTEVGPPSDLWALGCILYQFVSGTLPFQAGNEFLIFQKILGLEYVFPSGFDAKAKNIIENFLKIEPKERLGANDTELYSSIQDHPFYSGINFDELYNETPPPIFPLESSEQRIQQSPLLHNNRVSETLEPGFNPLIIAERILRSDSYDIPPWNSPEQPNEEEEAEVALKNLSIGEQRSSPNRQITPKSIFPADNEERQLRLKNQMADNPWNKSVKGNLILKQGLVTKRKGLFSKRRMLLLTEGPHLYYCEPNNMNVKGEIPWSSQLKTEPKDFRVFFVHTPNRTYYLEDHTGYALDWCKAINEVRLNTYENSQNKN